MKLVPKLRKEKKVVNIHHDVLIDEYAWINKKIGNPFSKIHQN